MEDQSPLASPDGSRRRNPQERRLHPPYSRESASEKRSVGHNPQYRVGGSNEDFIVVKVEDDDKTYKPYKEEEIPADSGAELGISRRTRRRLKAEEDEEPVVKDEELSPEMNAGGAYFTPGGLIISEPSNMEVNEESYYADHESQYLNNSWRGAWRQGHEWNLEEASQNGKEASRRLTSRESALARMRPSTRHGSRPNTSPTMILEKDKHLRDSRGDWGQTSISSSHFGQATAVYHHNVEDFDDNEDEEANTQTGVNKMRNVRFSERENMVLVERVISNFDILVGKLAARTEMSVKTHVWRQITEAVNAVGSLSRTVSNCKKRYQDIKRSIRRKCQKQRAHSRPKYLKPYERILRPYIHVHIRVRTTGGYHFQLEAESESDEPRKRSRLERYPRPVYTQDEHNLPNRYPGENSIHGDEEQYAEEEMFTEIGTGGAYYTPGRFIYSEPSNMEVEEGRLYADLDSPYANNGRRGNWKRGRDWSRHGSLGGSRSCPTTGRSRPARYQQAEEFDDCDDEEATAPAGSNRLRNVRFSERENLMLVEQVIENFDILVGKLAAKTETSMKNLVWRQITDSVNSVGSVKRSVPHCKRRYQDIKRSIRKKCLEQRKHSVSNSQTIFLHTYEGILKPYIHMRGGNRIRGQDESDSDADIQESPPPSPRSLEEPLEAGRLSPEPEEEAGPVMPEPRSLEESGEPSQDNLGESEAATSQLAPSSCSSEAPMPNNGPDLGQRSHAHGRQKSFAKGPKKGKLDDHGIKRFLREHTLHRKTLMRKLNALHEDVSHLTQTLAKATSEQNSLLARIVGALEERNRIETEQHKTLQKMSESLERTGVHRGLGSQSTND